MRFIWETSDIMAGRRVRESNGTEYLIGYIPGHGEGCCVLVNLETGEIFGFSRKTKTEMAEHLTTDDFVPVNLS